MTFDFTSAGEVRVTIDKCVRRSHPVMMRGGDHEGDIERICSVRRQRRSKGDRVGGQVGSYEYRKDPLTSKEGEAMAAYSGHIPVH